MIRFDVIIQRRCVASVMSYEALTALRRLCKWDDSDLVPQYEVIKYFNGVCVGKDFHQKGMITFSW